MMIRKNTLRPLLFLSPNKDINILFIHSNLRARGYTDSDSLVHSPPFNFNFTLRTLHGRHYRLGGRVGNRFVVSNRLFNLTESVYVHVL